MKARLKFLPFHLITALPLLTIMFLVLTKVFELENFESILISVAIYAYDVLLQTRMDYLEDQIKKPRGLTREV